ncbi:hypothetical protein QE418_003370 [Microbacterium testaceum]|uniref:hypothetical protein n=1 Tax=Microbacterium TaxID=33882 RepID=UPI002783FC3F|nr:MULTISPECIES: hypothetical protein [Microbacterium]MDQ1113922.1 hypothetical protein [Microbacterium testaceum]MDR6098971.1 hypothetical protein [Microbacterium sp. SORGH_AS_0454]
MADGDIPPWVEFVLRRQGEEFAGVNARLDNLVTRDAFLQEQSRVNEKFDGVIRDQAKHEAALASETSARLLAERTLSDARAQEQAEREREAGNKRWQIFLTFASPIAGLIVMWVVGALQNNGGAS